MGARRQAWIRKAAAASGLLPPRRPRLLGTAPRFLATVPRLLAANAQARSTVAKCASTERRPRPLRLFLSSTAKQRPSRTRRAPPVAQSPGRTVVPGGDCRRRLPMDLPGTRVLACEPRPTASAPPTRGWAYAFIGAPAVAFCPSESPRNGDPKPPFWRCGSNSHRPTSHPAHTTNSTPAANHHHTPHASHPVREKPTGSVPHQGLKERFFSTAGRIRWSRGRVRKRDAATAIWPTGLRTFFIHSGIAACAEMGIVARFVSPDPRR